MCGIDGQAHALPGHAFFDVALVAFGRQLLCIELGTEILHGLTDPPLLELLAWLTVDGWVSGTTVAESTRA